MSFDESPLVHLSATDVDLAAVRRAFAGRRTINAKDLRTLRLITRHQGRDVPTVAGIVLFGRGCPCAIIGAVPSDWHQPMNSSSAELLMRLDGTPRPKDYPGRTCRRTRPDKGVPETRRSFRVSSCTCTALANSHSDENFSP